MKLGLPILFLTLLFVSGCDHISRKNVVEIHLYEDDQVIHTYKEEDKNELSILVNAVNKTKKQSGVLDMPASDYKLGFVLKDGQIKDYLVWDNEDVFIMKDSSHYVQLSASQSENVSHVLTKFKVPESSGLNTRHLIMITLAIPALISLVMIIGLRDSKKPKG